VERYISGTDIYGCGFVKHNTNSGFVDEELHRVTPQVFSAFTFYESHGERLVADIQGVGDLYTDPQGTYRASSYTRTNVATVFFLLLARVFACRKKKTERYVLEFVSCFAMHVFFGTTVSELY
jgi:Alpha-kinase family